MLEKGLFLTLAFLLATNPGFALAQHGGHQPATPYAGQQMRDIKSLSAEDIAELRRGGGWGLARAAELNGVPGPAHLLELKDKIGLSADQVAAVQAIFEKMQTDAIREGERLIALERNLEDQFRDNSVTDHSLRQALAEIEQSRQALRYTHLAAHLTTPPLLSREQIALYNELRGYAQNPCGNVPAGHDPAAWRRHNGCK